MQFRLRTLAILTTICPPILALLWFGYDRQIPAILIPAVGISCSLLSASLSTLLFFWRPHSRTILISASLSVCLVYVLILLKFPANESRLLFHTRTLVGWDALGLLVFEIAAAVGGAFFAFTFVALTRVVILVQDLRIRRRLMARNEAIPSP